MRRDVEASTKVRAPIERAREVLVGDPGAVVADQVTPDERKTKSFHTTLAVQVGGGGLHHDVVIDLRSPHSEARAVSVPLSWHATGHQRLFPAFEGELEASGDELGSTLTLRGAYAVPLGPVGRVGERLAGKRVAHQSLVAFLEQSARRLDAEVARRFDAEGWHPAPYAVSVREISPDNYIG
ncbi:MAG: hypothetical protein ACRD0N_02855 [Acidimicrobiales bacterium]